MHISGVVIRVRPGRIRAVLERLEHVPGFSIDRFDEATGHVIAVLESETLAEQEQGLSHAQELPGVLGAAIAAHHCDPDSISDKEAEP